MEGSISVKAYLESSGEATEIRRFELDSDVSTSFEYLRSKIASIFPALSAQGFKIFWKGINQYFTCNPHNAFICVFFCFSFRDFVFDI